MKYKYISLDRIPHVVLRFKDKVYLVGNNKINECSDSKVDSVVLARDFLTENCTDEDILVIYERMPAVIVFIQDQTLLNEEMWVEAILTNPHVIGLCSDVTRRMKLAEGIHDYQPLLEIPDITIDEVKEFVKVYPHIVYFTPHYASEELRSILIDSLKTTSYTRRNWQLGDYSFGLIGQFNLNDECLLLDLSNDALFLRDIELYEKLPFSESHMSLLRTANPVMYIIYLSIHYYDAYNIDGVSKSDRTLAEMYKKLSDKEKKDVLESRRVLTLPHEPEVETKSVVEEIRQKRKRKWDPFIVALLSFTIVSLIILIAGKSSG